MFGHLLLHWSCLSSSQTRKLEAGWDMASPSSIQGMSRDVFVLIFRYYYLSHDGNSMPDLMTMAMIMTTITTETMRTTTMVMMDMLMLMLERKRKRAMPMMSVITLMLTIVHQKNLVKTILINQIPMFKWRRKQCRRNCSHQNC